MNKYIILVVTVLSLCVSGCSGFLDEDPYNIQSNEQVFSDSKLIQSALANLYGRVTWGQRIESVDAFAKVDEAVWHQKDEISIFDRNLWRVYDYKLIRNINQFLQGVEGSKVLSPEEKKSLSSEARFIRAWCYFCTARSLGGVPLVGDEVYDYTTGMDIPSLQMPRASEADTYDYIIKECNEIAAEGMLPATTNVNSARGNRWAAKMLEARAAVYAGSLAKYNANHPNLTVKGDAVGIDKNKATDYFNKAFAAADYVVKNSPYVMQDRKPDNKARNFYEAVSVKSSNTEMIWTRDYKTSDNEHYFTARCIPRTLAKEADSFFINALLNLIEEFEPVDTDTPGQKAKFNTGTIDNPVFYNTASELFEQRDPRLGGTVLYPGSFFNGAEIVLQAGQLKKGANGKWEKHASPFTEIGDKDENGILITSPNGPIMSNDPNLNKTGFSILKFLDEDPQALILHSGSGMWSPYFRISEAYLIAAEALVENNKTTEALPYINKVRERAGVKALTTVTFENIVHERRVEFAFEDHRFWDMKRWRRADQEWNKDKETSKRRGLYPYLVVAPGDPNNGKWFFEEIEMDFLYPYNMNFEDRHYYSEIDQDWVNKNPKLEKNPYQ